MVAKVEPKALDDSSMTPAQLQKAIDEQVEKATAKKQPATKAPEPAAEPEPAKKEEAPTAEVEDDSSVSIKVTRKTSDMLASKPSTEPDTKADATEKEEPKIKMHTHKVIAPLGDSEEDAKEEPAKEDSSEEKIEVKVTPKKEEEPSIEPEETTEDDKEDVKVEEKPVEETPAIEEKSETADEKPDESEPEEKPVPAEIPNGGMINNTDLENLSRQIGGDHTKEEAKEDEAGSAIGDNQQAIKTFDTNQYHLPIKPSRHNKSGMSIMYYFIIIVVAAGATLFVATKLSLIDVPFLSNL